MQTRGLCLIRYPALALMVTKADLILNVRDEANEQDRYNMRLLRECSHVLINLY